MHKLTADRELLLPELMASWISSLSEESESDSFGQTHKGSRFHLYRQCIRLRPFQWQKQKQCLNIQFLPQMTFAMFIWEQTAILNVKMETCVNSCDGNNQTLLKWYKYNIIYEIQWRHYAINTISKIKQTTEKGQEFWKPRPSHIVCAAVFQCTGPVSMDTAHSWGNMADATCVNLHTAQHKGSQSSRSLTWVHLQCILVH